MQDPQRISDLTAWVEKTYQGRTIPVSEQPYFTHVKFVAEIAGSKMMLAYETGMCHDMLEDHLATAKGLKQVLRKLSYSDSEIRSILKAVVELTDVYTKDAFPQMSKKKRKRQEQKRLESIGRLAQTVKYADLIYNINWVMHFKRKKVRAYLKRKLALLRHMNAGETSLRQQAISAARSAMESIGGQ